MAEKFRIRKGDKVVVLAGRDKGRKGEVLRVIRDERRVVVSGVNMIKRHQRPGAGNPGGIIEREAPIHISNVAHEDPKDGAPTRVGFKVLEDGRKVRVAKRSGEVIDV
ncbi:50S ribosomal protein L24 [Minwuia thermotolerans]|jgi:large subunit ribosomal protein L24|uniref:Large ribosomal subunit protein uL24 n=1 Tax=Minwuia thermotolerans TaxID=2056226 RepID=A0A2M9FYF5_9PROT|nr:50S ribosomal protein L24 [Minwuia thermotolerans]ANK83133.1 MAG: 50S ribosomal protein L24 [Rhizobiales bacterium NRL2]PJK28493.1 50S ribosomal protein L24 [Minwuia thermotolerans]